MNDSSLRGPLLYELIVYRTLTFCTCRMSPVSRSLKQKQVTYLQRNVISVVVQMMCVRWIGRDRLSWLCGGDDVLHGSADQTLFDLLIRGDWLV